MLCWQVRDAFGLDRLALAEVGASPLGPGEVRLAMRAWSLNYRDLLMAKGRYDPRLSVPYVPLSDGVGEVVEVGPSVTRVAVGDRACPTFSPTWIDGDPDPDAVRRTRGGPVPGVLAEEVVVGEHGVVRVPAALSDAEAATLPCAGVTAWSAVVVHGRIAPGATVLVLGTGGVSLWALAVARTLGARVVATTSTDEKARRLQALGAEHVVLHTDPAWGRAVRRWSGGGVDLVVEVGGAGTLEQSLDAVRVGGTVAVVGNVAGSREPVSVLPILMRQVRCQGVFVGPRRALEDLVRAVALHASLRPVLDRTFPFDAAPEAFAWMDAGRHVGKVCVARP